MEISASCSNKTAEFVIHGDIDEKGAALLSKQFRELTDKNSVCELILDFKEVDYISSSGIGTLILFYKTMAGSRGKVSIKNVSKEIHGLFLDLDINKIINISKK